MEQQELTHPDRRSVVQVCGLISLGLLGVPTIVACGSGGESGEGVEEGGSTPGTTASGGVLAKLADIPVGSALVVQGADGRPIAIVRTADQTVSAVSAVCTHQGTTVQAVNGELDCPSHGSRFAFDGSVKNGPASAPLAAVPVKIDNGNVVAG